MKLALKIDVTNLRATRDGVPRIVELLEKRRAGATFFFTLGLDHTFDRVWLPGTDLGRRCTGMMRAARDAGFETGVLAFDHAQWRRNAVRGDAAWTRREMERACDRYLDIFSEPARAHAAADWQMNHHAYRLTQRMGFRYCSDTRGTGPFIPVQNAEIVMCPQLPTTLPTLDELLATPGATVESTAAKMLALSAEPLPTGHVFTLRAGRDGLKRASLLERLLDGWRALGYELVALRDCAAALDIARLPRHVVTQGQPVGRRAPAALQGAEFLA
ncbi:MAG: polysaccharide deacetylase family protein [Burkholderiales bacterium]|nr:polysaccharide deacetylase family protein [Burkholderiales bacterium]